MRLIDANKLKITDTWALVEKEPENGNTQENNAFTFAPLKCVLLSEIDNAPTVEPENERALDLIDSLKDRGAINNRGMGILRRAILLNENKRPSGEWGEVFHYQGWNYHKCSNCHLSLKLSDYDNFCSNCGADMRKGGAE